jgi:four helix bundle protein
LAHFCRIARGSASELEYHLLLSRDLKLIKPDDYQKLEPRITEIKRMLTGPAIRISERFRPLDLGSRCFIRFAMLPSD